MTADATHPTAMPRLLPVLAHIQTALDEDLSLGALARRAGVTPWHFQRTFKQALGETPKQHVLRLRLERAALQLRLEQDAVVDVSLACGFASHEVFGRAFHRRFGVSPSAWRSSSRRLAAPPAAPSRSGLEQELADGAVSTTSLRRLAPVTVAWLRHVGPYEDVSTTLWDELLRWAERRGLPRTPGDLLGVALDAPGITAPSALRFDACLVVPRDTAAHGKIGVRELPGGLHGVTTHVGPFTTLAAAYRIAFARLLGRPDLRVVGLPVVERYLAAQVAPGSAVHRTEICVPVESHG
jgi:AraC family transcriptional regulator